MPPSQMTDVTNPPGAMPPLPEPFGHFCEWTAPIGYPPSQTLYYGGPGNGIDDDWNRHPEVHKNLPLYTADQLQAYAATLIARVAELQAELSRARSALESISEMTYDSWTNGARAKQIADAAIAAKD